MIRHIPAASAIRVYSGFGLVAVAGIKLPDSSKKKSFAIFLTGRNSKKSNLNTNLN